MGSLSSSQRRYSTAKKPSTITSSVLPTCSCQRGLASTVLLPAYSHESNLVFEWKSKSLEYGLFFGDTSTSRRSLPEPVLTVCCTSPYAESIPTIYLTNLLMASKVRIPRTSWKTMLCNPSRIPLSLRDTAAVSISPTARFANTYLLLAQDHPAKLKPGARIPVQLYKDYTRKYRQRGRHQYMACTGKVLVRLGAKNPYKFWYRLLRCEAGAYSHAPEACGRCRRVPARILT